MLKSVPEECLIEAMNESVGVNDTVCLSICMDPQVLTFMYRAKERELSAKELEESEFTWLRNRQRGQLRAIV